jgi:ribosomal protein S18 acetylase RimI-like enzyme
VTADIQSFVIGCYDEAIALWRHCEGVALSAADSREGIAAYLARNPGLSFIARHEGRLVGTILAGHDGRRGYIHHLAVDAASRRQGIGRGLVDRAIDALRCAGLVKVHLFILNHNRAGLAFWRAAGWRLREDIGIMSLDIGAGDGAC